MRTFLIAGLILLAACSGKSNEQGVPEELNASNAEATITDMNVADMNATDMNAADVNAIDMNATAYANVANMNATEANAIANAVEPGNAAAPAPTAPIAASTAKVDCDILGQRVSSEDCDDARALARDVKPGAAALDVPDPMTRGRKSQVTLVIDRRALVTIKQLEASGATPIEGAAETPNQVAAELPGKDYAFPSGVGRFMSASLAGEGFQTKLISPDNALQEIPRDGRGIWIWEVTPVEAGSHILTAQTEAVAIIGKRSIPLGNGMTSKSVRVQVRRMDAAHDFLAAVPDWLKLITAILVAGAALVGAWFGLRKALRG